MKITRTSPLTGKETTLELAVSQSQLDELSLPRSNRRLIQEIFPDLTDGEREFLKNGYTDDDWDKMFPVEER